MGELCFPAGSKVLFLFGTPLPSVETLLRGLFEVPVEIDQEEGLLGSSMKRLKEASQAAVGERREETFCVRKIAPGRVYGKRRLGKNNSRVANKVGELVQIGIAGSTGSATLDRDGEEWSSFSA